MAHSVANYKIYIKTWSDVFTDFELRHSFLLEKLKLERKKLISKHPSADEILEQSRKNTAKMPPEVSIPKS